VVLDFCWSFKTRRVQWRGEVRDRQHVM